MTDAKLQLLKETLLHMISVAQTGAAVASDPVCSRTDLLGDTTCAEAKDLEKWVMKVRNL